LERLLGITLPPLPRYDWDTEPTSDILKQFAEEIATAERARLHLGDQPIQDVFALLEGQGIKVFRLEAPEDEIDGAMVYDTVLGASLFVNAKHPLGKQNFIAAHQYAHLLKDRDERATLCRLGDLLGGERERKEVSRKEHFANLFAAAFLMPKSTIQNIVEGLFEGHLSEGALVYLRRQFGVSYEALFLRLKELGYWTAEEVAMWKEQRGRLMSLEKAIYGSADEPLPPDPKGVPILLLLRGWEAYRKGLISRNRVAELLKMTTMEVDDLVAEGEKIVSVR
ncbi:MAG: ImmA/IrrE family metallo-endopeptidase, partial [Armatimonadota bacterium]